MKLVSLTLLVLGLAIAATTVSAQSATYTLKGHTDAGANFWTEGTGTEHNPTLSVPASTEITLTVSAASGTHNLKVGDGTTSEVFDDTAAPMTVKFTSPASGDVTYICTIHGAGMSGKFHVGSVTATTSTPAATKGTPGFAVFGVAIAVVGAALLLRRK